MMKPEHIPDVLLAVAVLLVLAFLESQTVADPDLWGHVRFGQDILTTHAIPRQDPYSFTSDRTWINHEWLAELLMASAYGIAGGVGLIALKFLLVISSFATLWRALRRVGVFRPLAILMLLLANLGTYGLMLTVRPQLFSMFLFTVMLALLNAAAGGRRRLLLWMPVLFALWANMHGGWIVGLGVLFLWSACALLARTISWGWAIGGALLGLFGSLVTPYGLGLWQFLWETVGLGRADIAEWQPLIHAPFLLAVWGAAAALVVAAWRRGGWSALPLLMPAVVVGALALRVVRLEGFFTLASMIQAAPYLAGAGPRRLPLSRRPSRGDIAVVGAMCLAGFVAVSVAVGSRLTCVAITTSEVKDSWAPESEAVSFLRDNQLQGRLLSWFDYGEMAIWHLSPRLRVSYDGRRETVYSETVQNAHRRFYSNDRDASYARILGADYIWLRSTLRVIGPLERDGWVPIFRGARSVVLAKQAGQYTQPKPWTGPRCFPGP